jgi:AhpD family alkylhydroperoxidase
MMTKRISAVWLVVAAALCAANIAYAQEAPGFIVKTYPKQAINAAAQEMNALGGPDAAISRKVRELIGLGVAAQIPCTYCVYYHTKAARAFGASDAEIRETIAQAAAVRKWSTMLNGSAYDLEIWKAEVDVMFTQ